MPIKQTEYILALDQGTTGTRAVIFNHNTRRVLTAATALTPIIPSRVGKNNAPPTFGKAFSQ
ncbi:glycerol kinase [Weissella viridescens]|uniref:Glycerol kinase n=1 Tax=Weissella viridescens TaxID=1629 RepID=A0A380P6R4_WEIVI|nr:glycerol kinase [Weissella viridescens]